MLRWSTLNLVETHDFYFSWLLLNCLGHGRCRSLSQLHMGQGTPGPAHLRPYVSTWEFGTLLKGTLANVFNSQDWLFGEGLFFNSHNSDQVIMHTKSWSSFAVGHAVLSINGVDVMGKNTAEGKDILEYLKDPSSYPVSIRFGRARLSSNEKLMLASMFHS